MGGDRVGAPGPVVVTDDDGLPPSGAERLAWPAPSGPDGAAASPGRPAGVAIPPVVAARPDGAAVLDLRTAPEATRTALAPWLGLVPGTGGDLLALRRGADCLELRRGPRQALHRLIAWVRFEGEVTRRPATLEPEASQATPVDELILGRSEAIEAVRDQIRRVADYHDVAILLLGETGTGKELAAEAIHRESERRDQPFVAINCAAIPADLFESELFGHEAGSYTGARGVREGLLEAAGSGTLFLDEVGELPLQLQPKLLRAIETRTFRRVGSNRTQAFEARLVSATNRGLSVDEASPLRDDLQYRLAGFTILLPPLRQREGDAVLLARYFIERFAARQRMAPRSLDGEAEALLQDAAWLGNVRELRAVVEQASILARGAVVDADAVRAALASLPARRTDAAVVVGGGGSHGEAAPIEAAGPLLSKNSGLREIERELIVQAYREADGNLSHASRLLGIPRTTLREKLRRYGAM